MKRAFLGLAFSLLTIAGATCPVFAADGDAGSSTKDGNSKPAVKKSGGGGGPNIAVRTASFAAGVVVGTPIAVVRRTAEEIVQGTKDLVGDTDNWFILAPAGAIALPFGCVSGAASGAITGVKNAWTGSDDEPFSKESFSLGDL